MADLDPTAFDWSLMTQYSDDDVKSMCYEDYALLAKMDKQEKFKGKSFVFGVKYAKTRGRNTQFGYAQAYKGPSKGVDFTLTRVKDYSLASIDGETLAACEGDDAALVDAMTDEMDAAISILKQTMGWKIYGDGTGTIGTATNSSTTLTMTNADDTAKLEDGSLLVFSLTETGALLDTTPRSVTTIDRDAGTFVIDSSVSGMTGTFYAFHYGDHIAASDTLSVYGLDAWVPQTAPGATLFNGVNRAVDKQRLGGVRINCNGLPLPEALIRGVTRVQKHGGRPKLAVTDSFNYEKVLIALGPKVIYDTFTVGDISFEGIRIRTAAGNVTLISDIFCPANVCYLLDMRSWHFKSAGSAPRILKHTGQTYYHEATADGIEIRIGYYGNMYCDAPGWNAVMTNFG